MEVGHDRHRARVDPRRTVSAQQWIGPMDRAVDRQQVRDGSGGGGELSNFNRNFGSWHSGICQFVFGDGSVQALSNDIDEYMLGHICNIADGQVVDFDGRGVPPPVGETEY